jgi:hypothetical protein
VDRIKRVRIIVIATGIFLTALGFFLSIYSATKNVYYVNGIVLSELFYPYNIEGVILLAIGPSLYWFGIKYKEAIKGKKELLRKIFWEW